MQEYVLGIIYGDDHVLLIEKQTPEWQRGKYNFLGGKINEKETTFNALVREIKEECGLDIFSNSIVYEGNIFRRNQFSMFVYSCDVGKEIHKAQTLEKEKVIIMPIQQFKSLDKNTMIENLHWLWEINRDGYAKEYEIEYV